MAWFNNHYRCEDCHHQWQDEWSCMCDDDCAVCGARHMTPYDSDDLTEIVEQEQDKFVVLRSPDSAEHDPCYEEVDRFDTFGAAHAYLASRWKTRDRA